MREASSGNLESFVLGDVLASRAITHRTDPFLRFHGGQIGYGEVDEMANRVARGLISVGVGPGDHVAVMLPNCPEFLYVIFALARLRAVAVPVNTAHRGEMLRHVLADSDAVLLIADGDYVERLIPLAHKVPGLRTVIVGPGADGEPERVGDLGVPVLPWSTLLDHGADAPRLAVAFHDLQAIMFTSGTTGPSKGAMCSHALALTCAYDSLNYLNRWGKSIYCPLPLFHAAGLWDGVLAALLCGGSIAIVDRFHASTFWDDVRRFDAAVVMSVFSMIPILLKQPPSPRDKDHPLEMFYMGKSSLDEPLHKRFGVRSVETYTSTEAGIATGSPYGQWRVGSCGTVHERRFHAAVVDEYDREVGPGEPGELVLRPKQPYVITTGYHKAPDATARCFRNLWFHTGDRVWRDEDGYFFFLDRMTDSIRRRGESISAFDLECEVNMHPAVLESAAIGVPSELEEEDVKLAVVVRPGARLDVEELVEFCQRQLPGYMVPRYIEFVDALPRTPTDKVAKYRLREQGDHGVTAATWDRQAQPPAARPTTPGDRCALG
ncbi:AMP-binding protein [Nocardia otitidiscaviarum]|uniref:AMP-binding protein n=1 Tax=Nocardia otitidiscaviarum TaxID=1823 RepID=UPI0006948831|nr:AMP-binding protein [Nocardia otitidiscaviarum]MBF6134739.1 AMP-binding protein [Nocardia otitidiscaviarum]MBF6485635.1 AMP-binding protein [Nocardia otitidiscaviarum]